METGNPAAPARLNFIRAFRPFWITLSCALVLLVWDYNRRHGPRTSLDAQVAVEGVPPRAHTLKMDGRPPQDHVIPVGWRTIEVAAPEADSLFTNVFVWYGRNSLGLVDLPRSRGKIEFRVSPPPVRYTLREQGVVRYVTPTGFFSSIPAGEYEAGFEYGNGLEERRPVQVVGNERRTVLLTNSVGSIEIAGSGGEYVIEGIGGAGRWSGTLPVTLPYVRSGEYRLTATHDDYRLERRLVVSPGETNRMEVEFAYGEVEILTTPSQALVHLDGNDVGTTPLHLSKVIPGRYPARISKEGFDPVDLDVVVEGKKTMRLERSLTNTRYRQAMERVSRARAAGRFAEAHAALGEALVAEPGNTAATALLLPTKAAALRERAEHFIASGDLSRALEELEGSAAIEPDAPALQSLRDKIAGIRQREAQERAQAEARRIEAAERKRTQDFERAIAEARSAVESGNLERARERLAAARAAVSDHPEFAAIEAQIQSLSAKQEEENTRRLLEEQMAARRRELAQLLDQSVRGDAHRPVKTLAWRTTKSARQVEFACEPKDGKGSEVYELHSPRDYLITWRNGRPLPLIGTGAYVRFGAVTLSPGQTEIRAFLYNLTLIDGRPAADPNAERNEARARTVHESLKKALEGDLEPLVP